MESADPTGRDGRTMTLEAFADTIVPGERRTPGDRAVVGAAPGPGAVAAGALELLRTPATGITDGLDGYTDALDGHATRYAAEHDLTLDASVPPFVALEYADRAALVRSLTSPGHPEKELWVLLALFSIMAFDTGAHMRTTDAIAAGHPGLATMRFASPDEDGLWRFPEFSYRRELARLHPDTADNGSLA
ncbi:regulator [Actinomadura sp. CNU-125]|uniref:DUF5987 family protein n=1 Tax=Actinomadura sp. CNU-125 TaxID=1904961 RepID=UPI0009605E9B|nr:DUF5987 family protein [Actinomadura sp. CNU-125]OLT19136.1 regulator [Actinomadura sp. CNU-125]